MHFDDLNSKEFEIIEYLGGGGAFYSYLARQVNLGRYVVIRHIPFDDAKGHQRFFNELAALAMLRHPNNTRVVDVGAATLEGRHGPYVVLDYVPGESLGSVLGRLERLETADVIRIGRQLLGSLAEAHRFGLLHRQISPDAILLEHHDGQPDHLTLIDFGVEQALDHGHWLYYGLGTCSAATYAAPEVLAEAPPTARSDLYSVGALLYHCITGSPFSPNADTAVDVKLPTFDKLERLRIQLLEIIEQALHVNPEQRYLSAYDFLSALGELHDQAHEAALVPASMSSYATRPVMQRAASVNQNATLSEHPEIWVLIGDPALDEVLIERLHMVAAHYDIKVLDKEVRRELTTALRRGEIQQPWLVLFGDLHVIVQTTLLGTLRDLATTQRILVSAQLNGQMLEAAVNFCGVDRHLVLPVDIRALSDIVEDRVADCRKQILRKRAQPEREERRSRHISILGEFKAEAIHDRLDEDEEDTQG